MAIALVFGVRYLLLELSAHAFVVLGALATAGAIAARPFESLLDRFYDLFVGI